MDNIVMDFSDLECQAQGILGGLSNSESALLIRGVKEQAGQWNGAEQDQ